MTLRLLRFPRFPRLAGWLFAVTLLAGCLPPDPPAPQRRPAVTTNARRPSPTAYQPTALVDPPSFRVQINQVSPRWDEKQQRFHLILTNTGAQKAKIQAIVYARNETLTPPRRALSPPTASDLWFQLAYSRDGRITSYDIEHSWRSDGFVTAKLGKLARSWEANLEPGGTTEIEAAHDLEDVSPHPAFKGKKLAKTGYNEYQVWLFTNDGFCFARQEFKVEGGTAVPVGGPPPEPATTPDVKPTTKPDPKPDTKPDTRSSPPPQIEAAGLLRLANHYLDKNELDKGREQLEKIVAKFPDTDAAKTARQMLKNMK
jgi:hypothetical protein